MAQDNLKKKYGITDEELKRAVDQVNFGKIACDGAVLCALVDLIANGDVKGDGEQLRQIGTKFASNEHRLFYSEQIEKVTVKDSWHKALIYALGITDDCRRHFHEIYDIKGDRIISDSLHAAWVTGTDVRIMRLAFNLFTDNVPEDGKDELYTVTRIFDGYDGLMQYYLQAIAIRFA